MTTNEETIILTKTLDFVKDKLNSDNSGHDYWHVIRVYKLSQRIAKQENANEFIVSISALLHDIGEHGPAEVHTVSCAKKAIEFLDQFKIEQNTLEQIKNCILTHSWSDKIGKPKSIEAMIIADADALDAVGAIGIVRTAQFAAIKNLPIHDPNISPNKKFEGRSSTMVNHFYEKLLIIDKRMHTTTGKNIAKARIKFMQEYLNMFLLEWEGNN